MPEYHLQNNSKFDSYVMHKVVMQLLVLFLQMAKNNHSSCSPTFNYIGKMMSLAKKIDEIDEKEKKHVRNVKSFQ